MVNFEKVVKNKIEGQYRKKKLSKVFSLLGGDRL